MGIIFRLLSLVIGYLFGCINFGYIIAKFNKNIDIRNHGSGNSGATNAVRVMGFKKGALVFIGDLLKAVIAYHLVGFLFKSDVYATYAGLAVICGHNWPIWLGFKGGKGISASIGLILAVNPLAGLIVILIMLGIILITRYVSVASLALAICIPTILDISSNGNIEVFFIGFLLMLIAIYRHKENLKRLINKKENKISFKK